MPEYYDDNFGHWDADTSSPTVAPLLTPTRSPTHGIVEHPYTA